MNNAAREEKTLLRQRLLAAHRQMDAALRAQYSRRIAKRLFAAPCWQAAGTVFCYAGTGWEVETQEIIRAALLEGRRVGVPLCLADGVMEAHEITAWEELAPGAFHIPEPRRDTPVIPPDVFDLAVVPAVAFDRAGHRLGRGGGYYDRYLPQMSCRKAGVSFEKFVLPAVPHELHDVCMDLIFTEEGEYAWT